MIGKSMARGQDQSTPSAGAEAEGRSVGTRGWFIISECHWLTIIGELRSLWFIIILIIAPAQTFVKLHFFLFVNIFCQCAPWRITNWAEIIWTNYFNPKIEVKTLWNYVDRLSGSKHTSPRQGERRARGYSEFGTLYPFFRDHREMCGIDYRVLNKMWAYCFCNQQHVNHTL